MPFQHILCTKAYHDVDEAKATPAVIITPASAVLQLKAKMLLSTILCSLLSIGRKMEQIIQLFETLPVAHIIRSRLDSGTR